MRILLECRSGSQLYGTALPNSDLDLKSVVIPSGRSIIMCETQGIRREAGEQDHETGKPAWEREIIPLQKFLALLMEGQSLAVEMVFTPMTMWERVDGFWDLILEARPHLLGRNADAALGYAQTQAGRLAERGDRFLAATGLADRLAELAGKRSGQKVSSALEQGLHTGYADDIVSVAKIEQADGRLLKHLTVCGRHYPETMPLNDAVEAIKTLAARYGKRAREAAAMGTADWKALMHAVRVLDQTVELHETGKITLPRPNAAELLAIRLGQMQRAAIEARIQATLQRATKAIEHSALPLEPNRSIADALVFAAHSDAVRDHLLRRS